MVSYSETASSSAGKEDLEQEHHQPFWMWDEMMMHCFSMGDPIACEDGLTELNYPDELC